MGNQLFVRCLKGSLLVTFREFRFEVLAYTQNVTDSAKTSLVRTKI